MKLGELLKYTKPFSGNTDAASDEELAEAIELHKLAVKASARKVKEELIPSKRVLLLLYTFMFRYNIELELSSKREATNKDGNPTKEAGMHDFALPSLASFGDMQTGEKADKVQQASDATQAAYRKVENLDASKLHEELMQLAASLQTSGRLAVQELVWKKPYELKIALKKCDEQMQKMQDATTRYQSKAQRDKSARMQTLLDLRRFELLQEKKAVDRLGFLFLAYRPAMWWFEFMEMMRKLVISSVLVFVWEGTASQVVFAFVVTLVFLLITMSLRPFSNKQLGTMYIFTLVVQSATLLSGIMLITQRFQELLGGESEQEQTVLAGVLISLHMFVFVAPGFHVLMYSTSKLNFGSKLAEYLRLTSSRLNEADDENDDDVDDMWDPEDDGRGRLASSSDEVVSNASYESDSSSFAGMKAGRAASSLVASLSNKKKSKDSESGVSLSSDMVHLESAEEPSPSLVIPDRPSGSASNPMGGIVTGSSLCARCKGSLASAGASPLSPSDGITFSVAAPSVLHYWSPTSPTLSAHAVAEASAGVVDSPAASSNMSRSFKVVGASPTAASKAFQSDLEHTLLSKFNGPKLTVASTLVDRVTEKSNALMSPTAVADASLGTTRLSSEPRANTGTRIEDTLFNKQTLLRHSKSEDSLFGASPHWA
mmetsp:Transcript_34696/g.81350  ORF Transcript_34696/g.81350 Transcript_34696/m.81350 type:complete len:657 (-) Transcript_34696:235-2205(-)